jgi:hypothetical protein
MKWRLVYHAYKMEELRKNNLEYLGITRVEMIWLMLG